MQIKHKNVSFPAVRKRQSGRTKQKKIITSYIGTRSYDIVAQKTKWTN